MIRPMYASEFKSLIVYQDAGTMVLRSQMDWQIRSLPPTWIIPQTKAGRHRPGGALQTTQPR